MKVDLQACCLRVHWNWTVVCNLYTLQMHWFYILVVLNLKKKIRKSTHFWKLTRVLVSLYSQRLFQCVFETGWVLSLSITWLKFCFLCFSGPHAEAKCSISESRRLAAAARSVDRHACPVTEHGGNRSATRLNGWSTAAPDGTAETAGGERVAA